MGARAPGATRSRRLGADGGRELSEDGGPEAVEVSGARWDDELDGVVEEGEGGEGLAKARRHLVESTPRGEVRRDARVRSSSIMRLGMRHGACARARDDTWTSCQRTLENRL